MAAFTAWFWNERFWLPHNVTWADLADPEPGVEYPKAGHVLSALPLALGIFAVRILFEKRRRAVFPEEELQEDEEGAWAPGRGGSGRWGCWYQRGGGRAVVNMFESWWCLPFAAELKVGVCLFGFEPSPSHFHGGVCFFIAFYKKLTKSLKTKEELTWI
ncbi:UNVERIFIED_CONTAM: hypothetical protein FKN15_011749 [Acipenser sinensis]